jgi:hypothetical protein
MSVPRPKTKAQLAEAQRIREVACQCASVAITALSGDDDAMATLWGMTLFFEQYIRSGAIATRRRWGPKQPAKPKAPVKLRVVAPSQD